MMSTPDIVIVLGVITTSAVTIINALYSARGRRELNGKADALASKTQVINEKADTAALQAASADGKLDVIHGLTNSKLAAALEGLRRALIRIDELETIVKQLERRESAPHKDPKGVLDGF